MTPNGTSAAIDGTANTSRMAGRARVDWVDCAKGICIVMVVMMHSVLGVEAAVGRTGFMHLLVAFAKPFRMPDFFLISGLFLPLVINRDWRTYLDRKVLHFAYFYVLWVTIQFAFKASAFAAEAGWAHTGFLYIESFIEPFGTLWFIYLLPIFFVVTKATRNLPPLAIWSIAALLETAHVLTGWTVIDEFCARFVYFYSGYLFAKYLFALADRARANPSWALVALTAWAIVNISLVWSGLSEAPVLSLILGFAGAFAVVTIAALLTQIRWLNFLGYLGEHSIVIYLAFFLPMATTRTLLLHTRWVEHVGVVSLIVTIAGVMGAWAIWRAAVALRANFLFERPATFRIAPERGEASMLQPAE